MAKVVIVGQGGIGSHLAEPLCRLLAFSPSPQAPKEIVLVDGDTYEERNKERQRSSEMANKAEVTKEALEKLFPELTIKAKPHFVDENNIFLFVEEGDVVFSAVDNHPTRKVLNDHVASLKNALLISGGNELYDGNIQIFHRKNGANATPPLTYLHPEIENPKGINPAKRACGALIEAGARQLLAVNMTIAALMLNAFTLFLEYASILYGEVYFDLKTGNCRGVPVNQTERRKQ